MLARELVSCIISLATKDISLCLVLFHWLPELAVSLHWPLEIYPCVPYHFPGCLAILLRLGMPTSDSDEANVSKY